MTKVLISYRREDTEGWAGRLYDQLVERFQPENVFLDLDTIEPGVDFVRRIQTSVEASDVVLVLIGPRWLEAGEAGRPRLQEENDWVRAEIRAALERGVWTIPVLIDGAPMPPASALPQDVQPLARRNAFPIGPRFRQDVELLIQSIERGVLPTNPRSSEIRPATSRMSARKAPPLLAFLAVGLVIVVVILAITQLPRPGPSGVDENGLFPPAGTVSLSPGQGPYEQEIVVRGSGWPGDAELEVTAMGLARVRVNAASDGAFQTSLRLDRDFKPVAPNPIEIVVRPVTNGFNRASALYTILP